ncbi:MAG: hypothetical protein ACREQV_13480, partial [Candidatus Binatia bacterium]
MSRKTTVCRRASDGYGVQNVQIVQAVQNVVAVSQQILPGLLSIALLIPGEAVSPRCAGDQEFRREAPMIKDVKNIFVG